MDESLRIQAEMQHRHEQFTRIAQIVGWTDVTDVQMLALAPMNPGSPGSLPEPMLALLLSGQIHSPLITEPTATFSLYQIPLSMAKQMAELLAEIDTSDEGLGDPAKWRPFQDRGSN